MAIPVDLGADNRSAQHDGEPVHLNPGTYALAIRNMLSPPRVFGLPVGAGIDDITLALTADAFSRTYRSHAYTLAASADTIQTKHGLTLVPNRVGASNAPPHTLPTYAGGPSAQVLHETFAAIASVCSLYRQVRGAATRVPRVSTAIGAFHIWSAKMDP